jgi:hypothetical protein
MKKFYTLPLTCLLVCVVSLAHGQSRPSVSGNATRINTLESNQLLIRTDVNGNSSELTLLQQQIDANRASIDTQVPIQGPAGPAGAPGPLSGLQCEIGQFATWNGSAWVCTSMAGEAAPLSDDDCIRGLVFSSQSENFDETELGWNVLCEDKTQGEVTLSGPFTINPIESSSATAIELANFPDFSAGLVDVFLHPILLEDRAFLNDEKLYIKVSLIALLAGGSSEVGAWSSVSNPTESHLSITFAEHRLDLALSECLSTNFSSKPLLIGRDYFVQENLELRCSNSPGMIFSEHPVIEELLSILTNSEEIIQSDRINIQFTPITQSSLNDFNREYDNALFRQYAFPRLSRTLSLLVPVDRRTPTWQASRHSLTYRFYSNSELPR